MQWRLGHQQLPARLEAIVDFAKQPPLIRHLMHHRKGQREITRPSSPTVLPIGIEKKPIPQPTSMTVIPGSMREPTILSGSWSQRRKRLSMK
jgi:hypothetical protein